MFHPSTPWVAYSSTKDYIAKSRTSARGFYTIYIEADIRCSIQEFEDVMCDYDNRHLWDPNLKSMTVDHIFPNS